jgi:large subunit ribosomal protein L29
MKAEKMLKAEKMREWGAEELRSKEKEYADHLFRLRFQFAGGQTDALPSIRVLRKNLAKVKTVLRERELMESARKS